jgi:hypothetical protein
MKHRYFRIVTAALLAAVAGNSAQAQTSAGLQAGIGQLIHQPDADGRIHEDFSGSSYLFGAYVLQPLSKRFSGGISVQYLRRQFKYDYVSSYASNTYFTDIYKGSYLYFGLTGDVALGKKHIIHLAVTPAYGVLAGGSEQLYNGTYATSGGGVVNADSMRRDTKDYMAKSDFRIGTQLYLNLPVGKKGFYLSPGIRYNFGFNSLNKLHTIHPADLLFNLGVSYVFAKKPKAVAAPAEPSPAAQ